MENIAQYSVKENLLYSTGRTMWGNCDSNRTVFAANRAIYTPAFIAARIADIAAAQALPNDAQRTALHESIRIDLMAQLQVCCDGFQMLKLYLRHAFTKEQFETQYTDCGGSMYEESTHNRISCSAMMAQAIQYIEANVSALMANQNMPVGFQDLLVEMTASLNDLSARFTDARQAASLGAAQKVEANNTIYNQCIAMGLDGQQFFKNSPLRSQFSFEAVSSMLSPSGASTASFTIMNAETNRPMIAEVSNETTGRTVTADEDTGKCEMGNLAATETTFRVAADGFLPQYITLNLKTGTTTRATVELVPMVMDMESEQQQQAGGSGSAQVATAVSSSNGQAVVNN